MILLKNRPKRPEPFFRQTLFIKFSATEQQNICSGI
jgi:hypothetical protein